MTALPKYILTWQKLVRLSALVKYKWKMKHMQCSKSSNIEFNRATIKMRSTEQTQGFMINGPMVWFSRWLLCHHTGLFMLAEPENEYNSINRRTTSREQSHAAVVAA